MKNPNGYGSVFRLGGKRRRPWCVRVTVGWTDDGKQKFKNVGYYEDRTEAMIALANYNADPYNIDDKNITFAELFDMWKKEKFSKVSKNTAKTYETSFKKCEKLHSMKFKTIRKMHIQRITDENSDLSFQTRSKIKILCSHLYKFAIENDICDKDYSQFVEVGEMTTTIIREPFTPAEIQKLWDNVDRQYVDTILIMIYSGLRIGELIEMKTADVDLASRIMTGGIKTTAGKNRAIPINHKILPLIKNRLGGEYLITSKRGSQLKYHNYLQRGFNKIMDDLGMKHLPHDCRHTTATMLDNAGVSSTLVKKILGHSSTDVTERVYTHKTHAQLVEAIDKI